MTSVENEKRQANDDGEAALATLAQSVLGTFHTVEAMTESFMRQAILRGVFKPGERLNLDKIASALGVSRMPVRASLRQLESEGLVRTHAHRGATVSVLTADEIAEVYEMRILLECYLLEHAMTNLDDAVVSRLEAIVDKLERAESLHERMEQRYAFYELLYSRADRPRALEQVKHLRASVSRYLLLQRIDEPLGHHGKFLSMVESGDVDGATGWLAAHLSHVSEKLVGLMGEAEDPAEPATARL